MLKNQRKDTYQSPNQSSQIPARAESPHSLPSPPLSRGGEGRGEGGFESCAFTNFGSAVGIKSPRQHAQQDTRQR